MRLRFFAALSAAAESEDIQSKESDRMTTDRFLGILFIPSTEKNHTTVNVEEPPFLMTSTRTGKASLICSMCVMTMILSKSS